jgi:asparagine synthase (glutamine-hydrolysing)
MCGIAGFVGSGKAADIAAMTDLLAHRGPDGVGYYESATLPVFLGHRRLAIIDLAHGAQPMWNEDHSVCVVYNGEIYNFMELRATLAARGHIFRSHHSDTEVLVHGYEEWGEALPEHLNGMFAFAILDERRRRLFLARDRFGEKPLYYGRFGRTFAFASELPALLCHPECSGSINLLALQKFFAYGFIPAPNSLYRDCHKLPAGARAVLEIDNGDLRIDRYWRFAITAEPAASASEDALAEQLVELLQTSVRRRLVADVPLGVFLSGGLDSSTVLSLVARERPAASIETFTIGFDEPSYDESAYARLMADRIGTRHHEEKVGLRAMRDIAPALLARLGEPLGDPSILPTYCLSRLTRRHVTVALSGDGGDELFAGYDTFRALAPARLYDGLVTRGLHRGLRRLADLLPRSDRNMSFDFKLRRALMGLSHRQAMWNPVWLAPLDPDLQRELFEAPARTEEVYEEAIGAWEASSGRSLGERTLEFYTNFYLPDNILTKVDRASMFCSLETRAIFLDNDLVTFCQSLPYAMKHRRGSGKYLLRRAMRRLLPSPIIDRPKKGFGIPTAEWLRELQPPAGQGIPSAVRADWIATRWREHRERRADHRLLLWAWLAFASLGRPVRAEGSAARADNSAPPAVAISPA